MLIAQKNLMASDRDNEETIKGTMMRHHEVLAPPWACNLELTLSVAREANSNLNRSSRFLLHHPLPSLHFEQQIFHPKLHERSTPS